MGLDNDPFRLETLVRKFLEEPKAGPQSFTSGIQGLTEAVVSVANRLGKQLLIRHKVPAWIAYRLPLRGEPLIAL